MPSPASSPHRSARWEEEWRGQEEQLQTENAQLKAQLGRVGKDLTETRRKTWTSSSTEAGYTRQDLFVDELQHRFPGDLITPIRRGRPGADVIQVVRYGGSDCGAILWEVKRAAKWQAAWPAKLVADRTRRML